VSRNTRAPFFPAPSPVTRHPASRASRPPVLHDVNLTLKRSTVTALVGRSGAGKSTVAALLSRFYVPQQGQILLDGQDANTFTRGEWARAIAMVSQVWRRRGRCLTAAPAAGAGARFFGRALRPSGRRRAGWRRAGATSNPPASPSANPDPHRSPSCSLARSRTTSPMGALANAARKRSRPLPRRPTRTSSLSSCPTATRRSSASVGRCFRAGSGSASQSRVRCSRTRRWGPPPGRAGAGCEGGLVRCDLECAVAEGGANLPDLIVNCSTSTRTGAHLPSPMFPPFPLLSSSTPQIIILDEATSALDAVRYQTHPPPGFPGVAPLFSLRAAGKHPGCAAPSGPVPQPSLSHSPCTPVHAPHPR
jgi:energy-coupling factor transporter ATP-binding protein EcfA2